MKKLKPNIIELPVISDSRGKLSFVENMNHMPFNIKRIYYLYGSEKSVVRGGHAHKELQQLIISLHGTFNVCLDDGTDRVCYQLDKPWKGLYVPRLMWRDIEDFGPDNICLVLASELYDETDYIRNYEEFKSFVNKTQ